MRTLSGALLFTVAFSEKVIIRMVRTDGDVASVASVSASAVSMIPNPDVRAQVSACMASSTYLDNIGMQVIDLGSGDCGFESAKDMCDAILDGTDDLDDYEVMCEKSVKVIHVC